jgi:hypothetical protein
VHSRRKPNDPIEVTGDERRKDRVDDDMKILNPVLARDRNAHAVLGFPIPRGAGLTWWSVENREPVLLNDALHDPRVIQIPGTAEEEEAMIIVPLVSGDDVIGAMNIARTGGSEVSFTDADFELVQLFAGQAAVAITNSPSVSPNTNNGTETGSAISSECATAGSRSRTGKAGRAPTAGTSIASPTATFCWRTLSRSASASTHNAFH